MKKRALRLVSAMAAATVTAAFLACQTDVTEPTAVELQEEEDPGEWEYPAIYGRCYDDESPNQPIYMAKVTWYYGEEVLGFCITRIDGWYRISDLTGAWNEYNGQDLDGVAEHGLYENAYAVIEEYEYPGNYNRPFYMEPDPGHGTLTANGDIRGRVKDQSTNEYLYPALVTAYGYVEETEELVFLGYDTT